MAEVGTLLMALPFLSIFARPFFCALADRHQAHRLYLIGACFFMALGYGSLAIAPFFPDFIEAHGRLVWYLDMIGIIIGYSAYSVVDSLGDALVMNAARKRGISWSLYRVWSTVSWGVFGYLIGLFNETPSLPKYVPGIFLLICSMSLDILLLALWDRSAFDMNDTQDDSLKDQTHTGEKSAQDNWLSSGGDSIANDGNFTSSPFGTMNASNTRLIGALASSMAEDIGSTIRSSFNSSKQSPQKRANLSKMLDQQESDPITCPKVSLNAQLSANSKCMSLTNIDRSVDNKLEDSPRVILNVAKFTEPEVLALSPVLSSGTKLTDNIRSTEHHSSVSPSISRANKMVEPYSAISTKRENQVIPRASPNDAQVIREKDFGSNALDKKAHGDDIQLLLLKFIMRRDNTIIKYLISFSIFGCLESLHGSYFFLHVEEICRQQEYDFSRVMGVMVAVQSISEVFSFLVLVRYYMPFAGRMGSLQTCIVLYLARFAYYGTYFAEMSPYIALVTEAFYGFAYAILYMLICDCARDSVENIGQYLPELISRGLIDPSMNENQLKLFLRATMQGVFSGAFDGLGYGTGALLGGLFLNRSRDYIGLWRVSAIVSGLTIVYILLTHRRVTSQTAIECKSG